MYILITIHKPRQLQYNNKPTLGAQIRAHHSPKHNEMDIDEGTESESDSNSENDSTCSDSDRDSFKRIDTRKISAKTHMHTSSSHKQSSVWSRTLFDSGLSQSESDPKRDSKKHFMEYPKA